MKVRSITLRLIVCVTVLLTIIGLTTGVSSAASNAITLAEAEGPTAPIAQDRVCIEGTVIDPDGFPLGGWILIATPMTNDGELDVTSAISAVSAPSSGYFEFAEGLFVGDWQFSIELQADWEAVTADRFKVTLEFGRRMCGQIRFMVQPMAGVDYSPIKPEDITTPSGSVSNGADFLAETATTVTEADIAPTERVGCIEVLQFDAQGVDVESSALADWGVVLEEADGIVLERRRTDATGTAIFQNLPLGVYSVRNDLRTGWMPTTPTRFRVELTDGTCATVTFLNAQQADAYCIEGRTIDVRDGVGLPGWQITATPITNDFQPAPVTTDGFGVYRFNLPLRDERIPGAEFEICAAARDDWAVQSSSCLRITIPNTPRACVVASDFDIAYETPSVESALSTTATSLSSVSASGQMTDTATMPAAPAIIEVAPIDAVAVDAGPTGCRLTHVVKRGEGLFGIGMQYDASAQAMLDANPWVYQQRRLYVYPGQTLCIP